MTTDITLDVVQSADEQEETLLTYQIFMGKLNINTDRSEPIKMDESKDYGKLN